MVVRSDTHGPSCVAAHDGLYLYARPAVTAISKAKDFQDSMEGSLPRRNAKPGRGRPRKRTPQRGEGPMPRSLAMTFEYIRSAKGKSVGELDRLFRSKEMQEAAQFKEDLRIDNRAGGLGKRISAYEKAERDVSFGTQRRYAVLTETHTGVIHFISLFYAFLRCAAGASDPAIRAAQLAQARETAIGLKSLAGAAEEMVSGAESSGLLELLAEDAWQDPVLRRIHTDAVMRPLFAAYSKSAAGQPTRGSP